MNHEAERVPGIGVTYKVLWYETARGDKPAEEFVQGLDEDTQARFIVYVEMLGEHGPNLKRPYADIVRGKIRELRPRRARVLYFFAVGHRVILTNGVLKQRDDLDPKDIDLAESRMNDWLRRNGGGRR